MSHRSKTSSHRKTPSVVTARVVRSSTGSGSYGRSMWSAARRRKAAWMTRNISTPAIILTLMASLAIACTVGIAISRGPAYGAVAGIIAVLLLECYGPLTRLSGLKVEGNAWSARAAQGMTICLALAVGLAGSMVLNVAARII